MEQGTTTETLRTFDYILRWLTPIVGILVSLLLLCLLIVGANAEVVSSTGSTGGGGGGSGTVNTGTAPDAAYRGGRQS